MQYVYKLILLKVVYLFVGATLAFANPAGECDELLAKLARTNTQKDKYSKIEPERHWKKWIDDETEFRRFINKKNYDANKDLKHPTEIYGVENYLAWRKGSDFLNDIPVGKLELNLELFSKVHEISSQEISGYLKAMRGVIPDGYLPSKGGVLKRRLSFGRDPLFYPLTEGQYKAVQENPWLSGFVEVPWMSRPGHRRGILLYAKPSETKAKLEKLIAWYNENKKTMDPVELAARFQQAFVSIHPYIDGNGRASRLLMDRILREHGLPPPILVEQTDDIYSTPEAYTEAIRNGIDEYFTIHGKQSAYGSSIPAANRPNGQKRMGLGLKQPGTPFKLSKIINTGEWGSSEIILGGKRLILDEDGFFYSNKGIPYVYHEGKLYPVADATYPFYFTRVSDKGQKARISDHHREVYRTHFNLLREIREGKFDPSSIAIVPYETIREANDSSKIFLHDWQKPVFLDGVKILPIDPVTILKPSRIKQTNFEQGWDSAAKPTEVLAQYEATDLKYWKYLEYAKKHYPEAVPEIMKSREKLWSAGRSLMKDYLSEREALPKDDLIKLKNSAAFQIWDRYFRDSKLSHSDFKEALKKINDDKISLVRADTSSTRFVGFRSQEDYAKLFRSLPRYEKIRKFLKELHTYMKDPKNGDEIKTNIKKWQDTVNGHEYLISRLPKELQKAARDIQGTYQRLPNLLNLLNQRVFGSRYTSRGTSEEFERDFVDFALHANGSIANKSGISFTTNIALSLPTYHDSNTGLTFAGNGLSSSLFIAKLPKSKVEWNSASTYGGEYEVIGTTPTYPWQIKTAYKAAQLKSGLPSGLSDKTKAFLKKYGIGPQVSQTYVSELSKVTEEYQAKQKAYMAVINNPQLNDAEKQKAGEEFQKLQQEYYDKQAELSKKQNS